VVDFLVLKRRVIALISSRQRRATHVAFFDKLRIHGLLITLSLCLAQQRRLLKALWHWVRGCKLGWFCARMGVTRTGTVLYHQTFSEGWRDLSPRFWDLSPSEVPNWLTSTQLNTSKIISEFSNDTNYSGVLQSFPENLKPKISLCCGSILASDCKLLRK
jgi:hypothetical protein